MTTTEKTLFTVTSEKTSSYWNITEGQNFALIKSYWRNGEGQFLLEDEDGNRGEYPDIFFTDPKECK